MEKNSKHARALTRPLITIWIAPGSCRITFLNGRLLLPIKRAEEFDLQPNVLIPVIHSQFLLMSKQVTTGMNDLPQFFQACYCW